MGGEFYILGIIVDGSLRVLFVFRHRADSDTAIRENVTRRINEMWGKNGKALCTMPPPGFIVCKVAPSLSLSVGGGGVVLAVS